MLPKSRRLKTEDFKKLGKTRVLHAPHFFLRLTEAPQSQSRAAGEGRAAVIVSGSIYKKAVARNKLRRRMYHLIAKHVPLAGRHITITLKKGALDAAFKDLEQELLLVVKHISPRSS